MRQQLFALVTYCPLFLMCYLNCHISLFLDYVNNQVARLLKKLKQQFYLRKYTGSELWIAKITKGS